MMRAKRWSLLTLALAVLSVSLLTLPGTTAPRAEDKTKPIHALLVIGGCCHDYAKQKDILTKGISARANVQWTIAYDPDKGTKHINPIYEKPDWAKDFEVIVHDECCADVKDEAVIDRILEPHRQGLPAVVLHCGMHCYRSKGYPKMTPWFEFRPGDQWPRRAAADRLDVHGQGESDYQGNGELDDDQGRALQQPHGEGAGHRASSGSRQADEQGQGRQGAHERNHRRVDQSV
jgi:hypothetical protein